MARVYTNLKKYRKTRGITQEEFARGIGYTRHFVSKVETGMYTPGIQFIEACCFYFRANIGDLFYFNMDEGRDGNETRDANVSQGEERRGNQ